MQGDACATCKTAFTRSFLTYDHLPLVLFELAPGVSHDEALRLLAAPLAAGHAPAGASVRPTFQLGQSSCRDVVAISVAPMLGERSQPALNNVSKFLFLYIAM